MTKKSIKISIILGHQFYWLCCDWEPVAVT